MRCDGFSATSPIAFRLLGSSISDWLRALSGVRQGNVLGPLLFAIYINDLPAALSFARVMIYADDTQVHFHLFSVNIHQAIARTCIDAQAVADWARENGLLLNPLETKVMILGHELYTTRLDLHPPKSHDLWLCASARFWGTYPRRYNHANPRLEITRGWNHSYGLQHPFYSAFSSPLTLKIVEENSRGEPVPTLRLYVYSLPPFLCDTRIRKIEITLRACVPFVVDHLPFLAHVTPHLLGLHWLSAIRHREYLICTIAYSVVVNDTPAYLTERFCRRHLSIFVPRSSRTEAHKHSFTLEAISLLNSISIINFSPRVLCSFKRYLFDTFFVRVMAD